MADFRSDLYEKYITKFKGDAQATNVPDVSAYHQWCDSAIYPLIETIPREARVLELGCGPGNMLTYLKSVGFRDLVGIDVSAEQIEIAQQQGLRAEVADVFDYIQSHNQRYDLILAMDFVEHFSRDELLRLGPMIHQCLTDIGTFIIQTPNGQGLFSGQVVYGDMTHMTIFNPGSLTQLLNLSGFSQIRFFETTRKTHGVKGLLRRLIWSLVTSLSNLIRKAETGKTQSIWSENMICVCHKSDL